MEVIASSERISESNNMIKEMGGERLQYKGERTRIREFKIDPSEGAQSSRRRRINSVPFV